MKKEEIKPMNGKLLIEFEKPETKTASGILLASEPTKTDVATIIAVSAEEQTFSPGVRVIVDKFAGQKVLADEEVYIIRTTDVYAYVGEAK